LYRTAEIALRTSSAAAIMLVPKLKISTMVVPPSVAVERTESTPTMPCIARSSRLTISRSTVSGEAPG
jgi:hypothetical protein